ncbi:MAG: type VI secretion system baseplate subunit TssG [Paracoccaceae bacterium]
MATENRITQDAVSPSGSQPGSAEADLLENPELWEFFAAVRAMAARHPNVPGVGRSSRVEDDRIRFRQKPSLRMEPSEISKAERVDTPDGPVLEITETFFGPFGAHGALPQHITEDALANERAGSSDLERRGAHDLRDFTDLFTSRMAALLYRAWETTQIAANRDRGRDDFYQHGFDALFGQMGPEFVGRDALPDDHKRNMADWMANPRASVAAIESVLGALAGVRIKVDEFVAEWLPIAPEDQARLGKAPARLGRDIVVGSRTLSVQSRLTVRTEPLELDQFEALLPDGSHHGALQDAMRNLVGLSTAWELQLVLEGQAVPRLCLDGTRRLGWDSWAIEDDRFDHAVDVRIDGSWRGSAVPSVVARS